MVPYNLYSILKLYTLILDSRQASEWAMDGVSVVASVVALVGTSLKVASVCVEYYSHVKNVKKDADRLCLKVNAFISVLQNLDKLARSLGATRLFASRSVNKDI